MGKAISLLRPPQPPREDSEREKVMELRKRPRPPRVDPDFVSSPPPLPPRKRARKQAAGAAKRQPQRKRALCACLGIGSPVAGFHPAMCVRQAAPLPPRTSTRVLFRPRHPFNWYEPDMWTEVVKHLCGFDLVRLSRTCRWFRRLLADDSIWRYAFFRDLGLPAANPNTPPRPLHRSWRHLYFAAFSGLHAYYIRERNKHVDGWRVGGFLLESPHVLLTGKLPLPLPRWFPHDADGVRLAIEVMGACVLSDARPGIWIADMHVMRCPVCNLNNCDGTIQVLDARHSELFLEEAFWDGTLEYEDIGEHFVDEEVAAALCAIFNVKRLSSPSTACVLNTQSWIRKRDDLQPRTHGTAYAAAVNSNLQRNHGLLTRFKAMRDTTRDGQIVSIRISQQLF
ncbi:probable F-box protein At3g61730 [Phragmites australis]|uniref:probable F-box protein At3g61730 n=1 Tax=Phragmites australis TaxID=29695 RepID=UPI002D792115|nr:probable F-box protein At3g61730 [Phragmites australis]